MIGWVKLHRQFVQWEWFTDASTLQVFVYLMCMANHKDGHKYRGITLQPGQLITGRKKIAKELKMTEQRVRTCLNHLKNTQELTTKSTNRFTIITLTNWAKYQIEDAEPTNKHTNKQPTSNQQLTTFKNDKNVNNENNILEKDFLKNETFKNEMLAGEQWRDSVIMTMYHMRHLSHVQLVEFINQFFIELIAKDDVKPNIGQAKSHFTNWLRIKLQSAPIEETVNRPSRRKL